MADVIVTLKVMPDGVDVNLDKLHEEINKVVLKYGRLYKHTKTPVAFGLVSLDYAVIMPQKEGGTEPMEKEIKHVHGVADVQVLDVTLFLDVKDLASKK